MMSDTATTETAFSPPPPAENAGMLVSPGTTEHDVGYARALREQGQVMHALLLRELLTRFGGSRFGFLTIFIEPAIYLLFMLGLRSLGASVAPFGVDMLLFIATGIIPFLMLRSTVNKCNSTASANRNLLMITEIKINDAFFARIILEFFIYHTMFWITIYVLAGFGRTSSVESLIGVLHAFVALMFFSGGVGLCTAALCGMVPQLQTLIGASMRIVLLTSGVIISSLIFPPHIRAYLEWNPFLHIIEYLRSSFFPVYESYLTRDGLGYVWEVSAVLWMFGLMLVRRMRARMLER